MTRYPRRSAEASSGTGDIEARAIAMLRQAPVPSIPLSELRERLSEEYTASPVDGRWLHERLRSRPDLFLLLEPVLPIEEARGWSADQRRRYACALHDGALDAGVRVVLLDPASAASPAMSPPEPCGAAALRAAIESLRALAAHASPVPGLRDAVARGMKELERLHRTVRAGC